MLIARSENPIPLVVALWPQEVEEAQRLEGIWLFSHANKEGLVLTRKEPRKSHRP
jgi:hypothetical protein